MWRISRSVAERENDSVRAYVRACVYICVFARACDCRVIVGGWERKTERACSRASVQGSRARLILLRPGDQLLELCGDKPIGSKQALRHPAGLLLCTFFQPHTFFFKDFNSPFRTHPPVPWSPEPVTNARSMSDVVCISFLATLPESTDFLSSFQGSIGTAIPISDTGHTRKSVFLISSEHTECV